MKPVHLNRFTPVLLMVGMMLTTTCTDKWSEHYDEENFNLSDKTLTALIFENPDLSIFSNMIKITGYDKVLNASQSYTVWAPNNEALKDIDTTDTDLVREIVRNHIARSRITTSGLENNEIRMLNGKYIIFERNASGYSFASKNLVEVNLPSTNGLLHILNGYAPYMKNLWEHIDRSDNLDSLREYIYSQNEKVFDPINSVEIGVNEVGQVIYDTAFIITNNVLNKLGDITSEDSVYTAIMPDNTAWDEAYARIEGYFNFAEDAGSTVRQRDLTRWTLVKDMLFEGFITPSESMDSLVTTTGSVYYDPAYLFANTVKDSLSNGFAYVTNQMPYADTLSWFKELRVEAESTVGRTNSSSSIYLRTSFGSDLDVSNHRYILVDPTSTSPSVEFQIPNTLSAKYNIYCVFVPASIVDPSNIIPSKVTFILTYIRRSTGSTFVKRITPVNNVTNTDGMTKMLVDQFDFEYANVIDEDFSRVAVKLEVISAVTTDEEQAGDFTRTMRIDCIIFEPVIE